MKFYNRLSFNVLDKYIVLREITKELNEQMTQLLVGFTKYSDIKSLLIKGAEKAYDDFVKKYKVSKNIEQIYEDQEKVAEFFEIIYERFEKEIDKFFD